MHMHECRVRVRIWQQKIGNSIERLSEVHVLVHICTGYRIFNCMNQNVWLTETRLIPGKKLKGSNLMKSVGTRNKTID